LTVGLGDRSSQPISILQDDLVGERRNRQYQKRRQKKTWHRFPKHKNLLGDSRNRMEFLLKLGTQQHPTSDRELQNFPKAANSYSGWWDYIELAIIAHDAAGLDEQECYEVFRLYFQAYFQARA